MSWTQTEIEEANFIAKYGDFDPGPVEECLHCERRGDEHVRMAEDDAEDIRYMCHGCNELHAHTCASCGDRAPRAEAQADCCRGCWAEEPEWCADHSARS